MFSRGFSISNKLSFNTRPKLYIILKLCLAICIIIHRAFVMMANSQEDRIWKFILQIIALPLLLTSEFLLLWWCSKYKLKHYMEVVLVLLTQIGFSQLFIELSLEELSGVDSYPKVALFQEVLFLNAIIVILSDSKVIKGFIILYIAVTSCFRLTLYENKLYYISWGFMVAIFSLSVILASRSPKPSSPVKIINTNSRYSKLENSVEGVALIQGDNSVLYMNGLFKGLFEANTDKEALDRVLKLRRFESYSTAAQKDYLHDLKVRYATQINGGSSSTPKIKSSIDFNARHHTEHPTSLDGRKTGSFVYGGSLLSPRPSIFTHRPSINPRPSLLQGRSSILFRKESNQPSVVVSTKNLDFATAVAQTPPQNLPIIKINLQKLAEEDQKAGNESETRSPLIKLMPEAPSFGGMGDLFPLPSSTRDARLSSRSNVAGTGTNYIDTYQPEHVALRVDTQEKVLDKAETVEGTIEQMFANMSSNSDKRQNLVINQLIENMPFPLEILKGRSPSSPINPRQDSMTLGNSAVEKIIVTLKDTKHGTRIYELVLSPFIYLKKETICITVRDVSYELKSQEFSETLEAKNKALKFVSHEFRTPLNCSISLLDVMRKFVSKEVSLKYLLPAINSSKMLLNLANDILDHAQLQARKLKINIKPCKVRRILEEVIDMMDIQASAKHIHLKLDWDRRIPQRFYTDPNRLRQIMLNLVSNALKYTHKGTITLQGKYESPTTCLLSVIDTGVGISQRNLSRLFDEFTKIQENRHMNPNGVGLGLVISKMLSQELGHEAEGLMVKSEEGKGSNFFFVLESKIEVFSEAEEESEEGESLDENMGGLFSIKTTNRKWEEMAPKMESAQLKNSRSVSPKTKRKMTMKSEKESRLSIQNALIQQQEFLSRVGFLNFQFSKTVENLESIVSTSKKKSSDIELHRKSLFPSSADLFGIKRGHQRSFTMEDLGNINNINSDSEFAKFLRKIRHNCGQPKALLVDDSIFNLTALQALLVNTFGIESRVAMTGEQAIQEVIKNERCCSKCKNFKVIFMDVEMPQLNGFETTQILRKKMLDGEISFIPIVGVTGYEPSEKRVQCLTSGMNDMVAKPVSQQLIKDLIIKWMNPS